MTPYSCGPLPSERFQSQDLQVDWLSRTLGKAHSHLGLQYICEHHLGAKVEMVGGIQDGDWGAEADSVNFIDQKSC